MSYVICCPAFFARNAVMVLLPLPVVFRLKMCASAHFPARFNL